MSYPKRQKKEFGYTTTTPRCETCKSFQKQTAFFMIDGVSRKRSHLSCKEGGFTVQPHAVCERWTSRATLGQGGVA
ncbi:hypothetical protein [Pulveribacter sp.]|uniref:hypothetical protein n=1 Tax=Pulveribacter sp. TaxID=2678893 RepID=UPI0028AB10BF|nr:hypothetical protein [Pulveribacter sp.]